MSAGAATLQHFYAHQGANDLSSVRAIRNAIQVVVEPGILEPMPQVPPARYLLRAKDMADARYAEPLTVDDLAAAAGQGA